MKQKKLVIAGIVALVLLIGAGVAYALTRSGSSESPTTTSEATTTTEAAVGPVAPLTGLPLEDNAIRNRPVLTVKIDNAVEGRPQFGIDKADTITEEKVEGGVSRFMALFHSEDSSQVGPVRSLRTTDTAWLKPLGGMIAYSGGIPEVRNALKPAGITDIGADTFGTKYYKRRSDRPFEHSMYTITPVLRELTPENAEPAKPLYTYLKPSETFDGAGVAPVTTIQGRMGAEGRATSYAWTWDPAQEKYLRTTDGNPHLIEGAGQIAMTNVILQYTPYQPTKFRDRAGAVVDEAATTGTGEAWVLSDGKMIRGTWNRPTPDAITTFTDSSGAELKLQPGKTWLSLVPENLKATVVAPAPTPAS